MSALRATFLIAAHYGVALRPEDLPRLVEGEIAPKIMATLTASRFRVRLIERAGWAKVAGLGTAYPAMIGCKDSAWRIVVAMMPEKQIAVLDPAQEARGVQTLSRASFIDLWDGRILLARPAPKEADQPFGLAWFMPALRA